MVTIKLSKWVPINGLTQTSTSWQIAKDENFQELVLDRSRTTNLEFCHDDTIIIPSGTTYYTRAMRHFDNPTDDYWTDTKPIHNIQGGSSIVMVHDVSIDTPMVYVDKEEVLNAQEITIKTSQARIVNDGHVSTHWLLSDDTGILYRSMNNTTDKTEHTIPNLASYKTKGKLYFSAIHVSGVGYESPIGRTTIVTHNYNFRLLPPDVIPPNIEAVIGVETIDIAYSQSMTNIKILNYKGNELYSIPISGDITEFKIPWNIINPDSVLHIVISVTNDKGVSEFKTTLQVLSDALTPEQTIADYTYRKELQPKVTNPGGVFIPNGVTYTEIDSDGILSPLVGSDKVHILNYTNDNLVYSSGTLTGVSLLTTDNTDTYIKKLNNNLLLIDTLDSNNVPVFMIYEYSINTDIYTLKSSILRVGETRSIGATNAIVQMSTKEFIYIPVGGNDLQVLNIADETVSKLATVPFDITNNSNLIRTNGKLMVFGGSEFTSKLYNPTSQQFTDGPIIKPGSFVGNQLKTVRLINDDVLIFRTEHLIPDDNHSETSILYYDQSKSELIDIATRFPNDNYPKTVITTIGGSVLLTTHIPSSTGISETLEIHKLI